MQITEVNIAFVKAKDGLVGFASLVIDDEFYLGGIAIHRKLVGSGYRLVYPTQSVGEAEFSLFHPIRRPIGRDIERAIFEKLKDVTSMHNAGHDRSDGGLVSV